MWFRRTKNEIAELRAQVANADAQIPAIRKAGRDLEAERDAISSRLEDLRGRWSFGMKKQLGELQESFLRLYDDSSVVFSPSWDDPRWNTFVHSKPVVSPVVVIGEAGPSDFRYPIFAPFIGKEKTIVFRDRNRSEESALSVMLALLLRLFAMLAPDVRFSLLDPYTQGRAFPIGKLLEGYVLPSKERVCASLQEVHNHITRINSTFLDGDIRSFEELGESSSCQESYTILVLANFPRGFSRGDVELLSDIMRNGPKAGVYVLIHKLPCVEIPGEYSLEELGPCHFVEIDKSGARGKGDESQCLTPLPSTHVQKAIVQRIREGKRRIEPLRLADVTKRLKKEKSNRRIEAVVGLTVKDELLKINFGVSESGMPCAHGILAAMPGSGKSNLLHALILSLATNYSPSEVRFYLIDGKNGVEFNEYRNLPHCEAVSLNSPEGLSRQLLRDLLDEMERRNQIFVRAGVKQISEYWDAGQPFGRVARIVVVIDEFQELFENDEWGLASDWLLKITQQGRNTGIHLLLSSQRFDAAGMRRKGAILGSIHLRMGMRMSLSDIVDLTEFGRAGKDLLKRCRFPGQIVINAESGVDEANELGRVALIESGECRQIVARLARGFGEPKPIVFDGCDQPRIVESHPLFGSVSLRSSRSYEEWATHVCLSSREGGFGAEDWVGDESPFLFCLGREPSLYGYAHAILRRSLCQNILFVGGLPSARFGLLNAGLVSLWRGVWEPEVELFIVDSVPSNSVHSGILGATTRDLLSRAGVRASVHYGSRDIGTVLCSLCKELGIRSELNDTDLAQNPTKFFLVSEADRIRSLEPTLDKYSAQTSEHGKQFLRILAEGPSLGIHTIASFARVGPMIRSLGKPSIDLFGHRVGLQMSDLDSSKILDHTKAASLQADGAKPVIALYKNLESGRETKFYPYCIESAKAWDSEMDEMMKAVGRRRLS